MVKKKLMVIVLTKGKEKKRDLESISEEEELSKGYIFSGSDITKANHFRFHIGAGVSRE
jgi:hypothetical protein